MRPVNQRPLSACGALALLVLLVLSLSAAAQSDDRLVVRMPEADRERMRADMRVFLKQTTDLLNASLEQDMRRVEEIAAQARPPLLKIRALAAGDADPTAPAHPASTQRQSGPTLYTRMQRNLPQPFKDMLLGMREVMAEIEKDAKVGADPQHTLQQLSTINGLCVACHDLYRVVPLESPKRVLPRSAPPP